MGKHLVKVCCSGKCRGRGSDRVFAALEQGITSQDIRLEKTSDCFGYCGLGPNVAVDGNILHHMHPDTAAKKVMEETQNPSPRVHGLGGKPIDDLDRFLDEL